jgi:tRNA pseudouridine38-40 synthase
VVADESPVPTGALVRVRLTVAYDGSTFHGFAENPGIVTVGGTLRRSIERVLGHPVELACAGRTDRGVHAWGQVVSFDAAAEGLDLGELRRSVTKLCGGPIVVREAERAADDFHARFSARARTYRYTVLNREMPDPFLAATTWHVTAPLDLARLRLACDPLIGEHDFSSFCRVPKAPDGGEAPSLVRRVLDARWEALDDDLLRFEITATSFCHQMVRSIVGTLVEVGYGRKRAGDLTSILAARDRHAAGQLAPAHGLMLWAVAY